MPLYVMGFHFSHSSYNYILILILGDGEVFGIGLVIPSFH